MGCSQSLPVSHCDKTIKRQCTFDMNNELQSNSDDKIISDEHHQTIIDFEIVKQLVDEYVVKIKKNKNYLKSILNYDESIVSFFYTMKNDTSSLKDSKSCNSYSYQIHMYFVIDELNIPKMMVVDSFYQINKSQCAVFGEKELIFYNY